MYALTYGLSVKNLNHHLAQYKLCIVRAGSRGLVVERPIHNLKVAGSNPEVGNIFSERYLENWGCEERE